MMTKEDWGRLEKQLLNMDREPSSVTLHTMQGPEFIPFSIPMEGEYETVSGHKTRNMTSDGKLIKGQAEIGGIWVNHVWSAKGENIYPILNLKMT